ncbi:MAG: fused MFS/spermidine synthase [Actinomycetota bacterium]|nr:fused MFS/spermidine synthase [Actinomycetota bacterium]
MTYVAAAGLASALLFVIEPLAVRMMLPLLGGSAAVWNTAMVFFQTALLVGYLMAHLARRRLPWSTRPWLQIGLVALGLVALPVAIPAGWDPPADAQALWVLAVLFVMLGLPFAALSMLSPTLQAWLADTSHPRRAEPYFLYAAGNVGAVIGLLGYPLLVEPFIGLREQARLWTIGYVILLGLLAASAMLRQRYPAPPLPPAVDEVDALDTRITWRRRGAWVIMAAVPSGLLLAVTQHISTDVASIPLLWVVPLTIYLATFVVAFARPTKGCPPGLGRIALIAVILLAATLSFGARWLTLGLLINLGAFAVLALAVHFELAGRRPTADRLTEYYLWIAVGGLVGGVGVALIAPVAFNRVTEYPLLVIAVLAILWWAPFTQRSTRKRYPLYAGLLTVLVVAAFALGVLGPWILVATVVAIGGSATYLISQKRPRVFIATMAAVLAIMALVSEPSLHESRTFFGVLRVYEENGIHVLVHGSTVHGSQEFAPEINVEPRTYYRRDTGVGRVMDALAGDGPARRFAVVGLGAGTLAAYGRPADSFEFYEIDRAVLDIAEDHSLFTFLSDSRAAVFSHIVDGRIGLQNSEGDFDLIVLDAFSSDAIPVHLLTNEAMSTYMQKLSSNGALAVHISNKYFDLEPVVARLGIEIGLVSHVYATPDSVWMMLSRPGRVDPKVAEELHNWTAVPAPTGTPLWTDDYANLLAALKGF